MRYAFLLVVVFLVFTGELSSQTANDILNILVEQETILQNKADSLRAEYSIKQLATPPDKKLRIDAELSGLTFK